MHKKFVVFKIVLLFGRSFRGAFIHCAGKKCKFDLRARAQFESEMQSCVWMCVLCNNKTSSITQNTTYKIEFHDEHTKTCAKKLQKILYPLAETTAINIDSYTNELQNGNMPESILLH